jgi:AraC-like DNA-binding protein
MPAELYEKMMNPYQLDYYFFLFVSSGVSNVVVDMEEVSVSAGQLLFVLPNQVITPPRTIDPERKYYKIGFDDKTLALLPQQFPFLINPLNLTTISFDEAARERLNAVFEILHQLLNEGSRQQDMRIILAHLNTLLTEIDIAYFKHSDPGNSANPKLSKYIEFKLVVESHLTEQHMIHDIAGELALTTNSLYGIVKEFSGISPKEYITNRLMLEAQRKLHYSGVSVKEVAYELGFSDPDYFSRLFKKVTGKSVSRYLQDLSGK